MILSYIMKVYAPTQFEAAIHVQVCAGIVVYGLQLDIAYPFHLDDVLFRVLTGKALSDGVIENLIRGLFTVLLSKLKEIHK